MNAVEWQTIVKRYSQTTGIGMMVPREVREDIGKLIQHAAALHRMIEEQKQNMEGAKRTILSLCKAIGGSVEIPFALEESLVPTDILQVSDIQTPHGMVKRFAYKDGLVADRT